MLLKIEMFKRIQCSLKKTALTYPTIFKKTTYFGIQTHMMTICFFVFVRLLSGRQLHSDLVWEYSTTRHQQWLTVVIGHLVEEAGLVLLQQWRHLLRSKDRHQKLKHQRRHTVSLETLHYEWLCNIILPVPENFYHWPFWSRKIYFKMVSQKSTYFLYTVCAGLLNPSDLREGR